ncbi:MAG: hypothetical protein BJ554DRAFT_2481 [Olpidium bornovanus]|uniref:Uncharacterized protein n=1 Tax=Olpidium bornovanus TaxID=278681 RepID=A0A8H7ZQY6_9FUNG|nr:MAG: hypothetical protein BJ554DRAFT_2481 [Olpidium bornovanus]
MPERTEAALTLWKAGEEYVPVHTFRGHRAAIREFVWRVRGDAGEGHGALHEAWQPDPRNRCLVLRLTEVGHVLCPRATVGSESAPSHSSQTVSQVPFSFRDPPILFPVAEVSKLFRRDEVDVDLEATAQQNFGGSVGFVPHMPTMSHYREHRSLSPLGWMQSVRLLKGGDNGLTSVSEEIAWLSARYHHGVEFEKVAFDYLGQLNFFADNSCTIALRGPWSESGALAFVRVRIVFPPGYPREASPRFEVQTTEMISATRREQISRSLDEIAAIRLAEHSPCLEECIRFLLGCSVAENGIDSLAPGFEDSDDEIPGSSSDAAHLAPDDRRLMTMVVDRGDANVPFPRMCGAVFGPDGKLAYFLSPLASAARRGVGVNTEEVPAVDSSEISGFGYCHPRSYETLEQYRALSMLAPRAGGLIRRINTDAGLTGSPDTASLYDGSSSYDEFDEINELTNIPSLYFKFRVGGLDVRICGSSEKKYFVELSGADPVTLCYRNADAARAHRRPDLSRIWQLAALVLTECVPRGLAVNCADSLAVPWNGGGRIEWAAHPLGTKLVEDL